MCVDALTMDQECKQARSKFAAGRASAEVVHQQPMERLATEDAGMHARRSSRSMTVCRRTEACRVAAKVKCCITCVKTRTIGMDARTSEQRIGGVVCRILKRTKSH